MLYRVTDTVHVYPIYRVEVEAATPVIAAVIAIQAMADCPIGEVDKKVVNEILGGLVVVELPGVGELCSGKLAAGTPVKLDMDQCWPELQPKSVMPVACSCGNEYCESGFQMCPECIANGSCPSRR